MRYYSTRDSDPSDQHSVDFEEALFSGYTNDGGLYVPRDMPKLDWTQWKGYNYKQIVAEILKAFVDDERIQIDDLVESAYSSSNFDHPDIVPIVKLSNDGLYITELFHGPTWSFKDYALQIIGRLLEKYLQIRNGRLIILIVTTGDTGSAAIEAVKNCPNIDIMVFFPHGRITDIQERLMTNVISNNVRLVPSEGVCGDLDNAVRAIFSDSDFVKQYSLASINSINWARIMVQMAHWFYSYLKIMQTLDRIGDQLTVAVPTGAAGNLSAALYARKLGLPLSIVACNNENDTVDQWLKTDRLRYVPVKDSLASAMDIDLPMNIERIIHLLSYEGDESATKAGTTSGEMMRKYYDSGEAETPVDLKQKMRSAMTSCSIKDREIEASIKRLHADVGYVCCPHTATAVRYAYDHPESRPIVCAATASPYKFLEIMDRFGMRLDKNPKLDRLRNAPTKTSFMLKKGDDWVNIIKREIVDIFNNHGRI